MLQSGVCTRREETAPNGWYPDSRESAAPAASSHGRHFAGAPRACQFWPRSDVADEVREMAGRFPLTVAAPCGIYTRFP
jgi:hypothetical protein